MNSKNSVLKFIEIRYADPICAIDLNDKSLILGSMLGRSAYYSIQANKFILLTETKNEHISGAQFSKNDDKSFFLSVGDEEVLIFTTGGDGVPNHYSNDNYDSKAEHDQKCESCYCLLYDNLLLSLFLHLPGDNKVEVTTSPCDFIVKNLVKNASVRGQVEMSNYAVPFDYNGKKLIWIDFYDHNKRSLLVFDFASEKLLFNKELKESFGHVSHCKLLPNGQYFLVRKYFICEIRDDQFNLVREFSNNKKEVLACDYITEKENNLIYCILDIDGNVCLFNSKIGFLEKAFNMYDLSDISQEMKDKQFFSMGYPYFIKISQNYFAITTDYGCYLIKR